MPHDRAIADRVRRRLGDRTDVVEKPIIGGGLGFMVGGHLCCGVSVRGLTVRVGPDAKTESVAQEHVHPLIVGKRETAAFVVVESCGPVDEASLNAWVDRGLRFVDTLE